MSETFFFDQKSNAKITYKNLLSLLNQNVISFSPYCYTRKIDDIFMNIIYAMYLNKELTLLDYDFKSDELRKSIGRKSIPKPKKLKNPAEVKSFESLIKILLKNSRWKLNLFTSGTTGPPQKATHNAKSLLKGIRIAQKHRSYTWGLAYNPTHIAAIQVFLQALLNKNTIINIFNYSIIDTFKIIKRYNITHISATPTYYRLISSYNQSVKTVVQVTSGGEKYDKTLESKLRAIFPNAKFLNIYASTEAGTLLISKGESFSIDNDYSDYIKIEDNQIFLHKDIVSISKLNQLIDNWYPTGDIIEYVDDTKNKFKITMRKSDKLNIGGYIVNPYEIENELIKYPDVINARVYGKPNSVIGTILCADIHTSKKDIQESRIRLFLKEKLQDFKIPRFINFVDSIKTSRTGKVHRI